MSFSFCWTSFLLSAAIAPPSVTDFGVEYKKADKTSQRKLGNRYLGGRLLHPDVPSRYGCCLAGEAASGARFSGASLALWGEGGSQRKARSLAGRNLEGFTGAPWNRTS